MLIGNSNDGDYILNLKVDIWNRYLFKFNTKIINKNIMIDHSYLKSKAP